MKSISLEPTLRPTVKTEVVSRQRPRLRALERRQLCVSGFRGGELARPPVSRSCAPTPRHPRPVQLILPGSRIRVPHPHRPEVSLTLEPLARAVPPTLAVNDFYCRTLAACFDWA